PCIGDEFVHPVQRTQERRFAAPRRADQRGHRLGLDRRGDIGDRTVRAVVEREVRDLDTCCHDASPGGDQFLVLGEKKRAASRPARLSTSTMMISRSAADQARSKDGSWGTPGFWYVS